MFKKLFNKFSGKNVEPMSFMESMNLTELPVVTFYQEDKKFNFLLDTGSSDCIIDSNILDQIEHEESDLQSNLFGLEGKRRLVKACRICLSYKGGQYEYDYLISDMKDAFTNIKQTTGVTLHGILGSKFFNTYKYILDFDKMIAYSKV
jgi:hypothetical protein